MNPSFSGRLKYDPCATQQWLNESTKPLGYMMSPYKYENCNKCIHGGYFPVPFDGDIVDAESELTNRTRPASKCNKMKYSKYCKKNKYCTSTFDPSVKPVFAPDVCPIVYNNIPKPTGPGYVLETGEPFCNYGVNLVHPRK